MIKKLSKKCNNVCFLSPKCGHSEMEQFVRKLEKNLEDAVKGLTPQEVLCTVLVIRDLSEMSRERGGGENFKFGFENEVTHPYNGSEVC